MTGVDCITYQISNENATHIGTMVWFIEILVTVYLLTVGTNLSEINASQWIGNINERVSSVNVDPVSSTRDA